MNLSSSAVAILALVFWVGCDNVDEANLAGKSQTVANDEGLDPRGAGYVHRVTASRFHIGATREQKSELGFVKLVGSEGVFATVEHSGWVIGIPNADSSAKRVPPLTQSEEVHNRAVLDYFVSAGLPKAQIATIVAHASMHQNGP